MKKSLPSKKVLRVRKPLYGIQESRLYWYFTLTDHHNRILGTLRSRADPCLLYKYDGKRSSGMVVLQIDDSLIAGCKNVWWDEEKNLKHSYRD